MRFLLILAILSISLLFWGCGGVKVQSPIQREQEVETPEEDFGVDSIIPQQGSGWSIETVDAPPNIGWQTSIAVDKDNNPSAAVRISYHDQALRDLKLASGVQGGPWTISTLDAPFDVGKYNSLVWDGISAPQISYYQAVGKLKAHQGVAIVVDPEQDLGAFNDITASADFSSLHISYTGVFVVDRLNRRAQLRHASFNGSSWSTEVVDDGPASVGSFSFSSIARNPITGDYHISYRGQNGRLKHAWGNTGAWNIEEVLPGNTSTTNVGQTSILVASDGTIHIFHNKTGVGAGLYHAWKNGASWSVELLGSGYGIMTPSAAVQLPDRADRLHIAAYKSRTQDLVHFFSGYSWTVESVDTAGNVGKFASIAVDFASCLHIAYVNDTTHDLKYATKCLMPEISSITADPSIIYEGGTVTLSVSASDPEGEPMSYEWSQIAPVSPQGLFEDPDAAVTPWRAPPIPDGPVVFTLRATVCDPTSLCDTATVDVEAEDIFDGPAYGSTGVAGVETCQGGFGPSGFFEPEAEPPQIIPLLTPDEPLYLALKENPSAIFPPSVPIPIREGFAPAVAPSLLKDFPGISYTGLRPPDPHLAAGPSHLIALVNSRIGIFDKDGNKLLDKSAFSWFSPVNDQSFIFDPKVNYDGYNHRWLILFHATNFGAGISRWLLAASQTSDPMGCWWLWILDNTVNGSTPSSPLNWADYTDMGFDGNYIYLSSNQFTFPPYIFQYTKVRVLKASEVYSGSLLNWVDYWNFLQADGNIAFNIRPAYSVGVNLPPYEYLANAHWPGDIMFTLWGMKEPFLPTPGFLREGIPVNPYSLPPDATQPGTSCRVDTIDSRIMNVVWRDGSLWTVQNTSANWGSGVVAALKFHHINTDTLAVLDDIYFGEDGIHYFDGAVMEDVTGNMVTVFARASSTIYPGAYYTVKRSGEGIDPVIGVLRAGGNIVTDGCGGRGARWGDYAGNWIDPTDRLTFWIFHEYVPATPGNTWDTWIGALMP